MNRVSGRSSSAGKVCARRTSGMLRSLATASAAAVAGLVARPALAADKWYVGPATGGAVNTSSNWSLTSGGAGGAGVPTGADTMRLENADTTSRNVLLNTDITLTGGATNALRISNTGNGTNTLSQTSGFVYNLSVGWEDIGIGSNGRGAYVQSNGTNHADSYISLGSSAGSTGAYTLTGGAVTTGALYVGNAGSGDFNQTGGTVTGDAPVFIGNAAGSTGTYTLGGTGKLIANASTMNIGYNGAGTFTQSGATNVNINNGTTLRLGANSSSSSGTYNLNGGNLTAQGVVAIGENGTGVFNQTAGFFTVGTPSVNRTFHLGYFAGSTGSYTLGGTGSLTVNGSAYVGGSPTAAGGSGSLSINTGGSMTVTGTLKLWDTGSLPTSRRVNLAGGTLSADSLDRSLNPNGLNWTAGNLILNPNGGLNSSVVPVSADPLTIDAAKTLAVGKADQTNWSFAFYQGTATQTGGSNSNYGSACFASSYTLSGGNLFAGKAFVGFNGAGTFTQTGGTFTAENFLASSQTAFSVGGFAGDAGTYSLSGSGTLKVNDGAEVGGDGATAGGTGVMNISGGSATIRDTLKIWNTSGTAVNLSGGTLSVGSLDTSGNPSRFNWAGGHLIHNNALNLGGGTALGTTLSIDGTKTLTAPAGLFVGYGSAAASITQTGGSISAAGGLSIGAYASSSGTVSVSGGTFTATNVNVGGTSGAAGAPGTLIVSSNAAFQMSGELKVWSAGTVSVPGSMSLSAVTNAGSLSVGGNLSSQGAVSNSGTLTVGGTLAATLSVSNTGVLNVGGGGVHSVASLVSNGGGVLNFASSTPSTLQVVGYSNGFGGNITTGFEAGALSTGTGGLTIQTQYPVTLNGPVSGAGVSVVYSSSNVLTLGAGASGTVGLTGGQWTGTLPAGVKLTLGGVVNGPNQVNTTTATVDGTLVLQDNATYSGTVVNNGTLTLGVGSRLIGSLTNNAGRTVSFPGSMSLNAVTNAGSMSVGGNLSSQGAVSNSGTLTVGGTLAATLSVSNTGVLNVGGGGVHSVGSLVSNGGGTLNFTSSTPSTLQVVGYSGGTTGFEAGALSTGAGGLTIQTPYAVTLNGPVSGAGLSVVYGSSISGGAFLTLGAGASGTVGLTGGRWTGTLPAGVKLTLGGVVNGPNQVSTTATVDGTLVLQDNATYSGTVVNNGTLTLGVGSRLIGSLTNNAGRTVSVPDSMSLSAVTNAGSLNVGGNLSTDSNLTNSGTLTVGGTLSVGLNAYLSAGKLSVGALDTNNDPSRFHWTAGELVYGTELYLGAGTPLGTSLSIDGTKSLTAPAGLFVGDGGAAASLTQTGGSINAACGLSIGAYAGSSGTVLLTGGTFAATDVYVGGTSGAPGAPGTLTVNGNTAFQVSGAMKVWSAGTVSVPGAMSLNAVTNAGSMSVGGNLSTQNLLNSSGTLTVGGTLAVGLNAQLSAGKLSVGALDTGGIPSRFNWTGGTLAVTGSQLLIDSAGPLGASLTLNASGKNLTVSQIEIVGNNSVGTVSHSAGTHTTASTLFLGANASAAGSSYTLSGTGVLNANAVAVGYNGASTFTQTGGTNAVATTLQIAANNGAGSYAQSGGTLTVGGSETIGAGTGVGRFTQSGGLHEVLAPSSTLVMGASAGYVGHYALSGNATLRAANETVGQGGSGTFTQTGGANQVTGTLRIAANVGSSGTYVLSGGTLSAPSLISRGAFNWSGGTLSTSSVQLNDGGTMTIAAGSGRVLNAATLAIDTADNSKLDLGDNAIVLSSAAAGTASGGTYGGVQGLVQRASNGGAWDGAGITTSRPDAAAGLTSIAVATGEQARGLGAGETATFRGQTVTAASVIAMYTYAGDANLDGMVSGDDYSAIDFSILNPGTDGWVNGDFNYDGAVTGDDYSAIDFNILAQGAPFPTGSGAGAGGMSATSFAVVAVPEPATLLPALALPALLNRRRRVRS